MDADVRSFVVLRDGGCVARFVNSPYWAARYPMLQGLPAPGACTNEFGGRVDPNSLIGLTYDHVKRDLRMAVRAEDHPALGWMLCAGHHGLAKVAGSPWATRAEVRDAARLYIAAANEAAKAKGFPVWKPEWDEPVDA